jgi:hypothetical protein
MHKYHSNIHSVVQPMNMTKKSMRIYATIYLSQGNGLRLSLNLALGQSTAPGTKGMTEGD